MTQATGEGAVIGCGANILSILAGLFVILSRDGVYDVEDAKFIGPWSLAEMFI